MFNNLPLSIADKIVGVLEEKAEKSGEKPILIIFSVYNLAQSNSFD